MIEGKKFRKQIDRNDLLSRINPLDVYQFYIASPIDLNRAICSPFRNDRNPSFVISDRDGKVHHFDFSDEGVWGNCIDFVMKLYNLPFKEALERINYDMNVEMMPQIYTINNEEEKRERVKKDTSIIVKANKWDEGALEYWKDRLINVEDLKREKIYNVKELYIDRIRWAIPKDEYVYAYLINDKWFKIYRPFVKDKKLKWRYNGPNDYIEKLYDVPTGGNLIITKARKDRIILSKMYDRVVNTQNECLTGFNRKNIAYIKDNFDQVFINFDCDDPGVKASWKITTELGFRHVNVPYIHLKNNPPIKDFSDWALYKGIEPIKEYLISKNIINGND